MRTQQKGGHGAMRQKRVSDSSQPNLMEDPLELLKKRVYRFLITRLGITCASILVAMVLTWWEWDKVREFPGVAWMVESIGEIEPVPQAAGNKFAIAIVNLENDKDGAHQRLIRDALARQEGVELLMLNRTVSVERSRKPQDATRAGHDRARELLKQSHADVMIWGAALDVKVESPMSLHWTTASKIQVKNRSKPTAYASRISIFRSYSGTT